MLSPSTELSDARAPESLAEATVREHLFLLPPKGMPDSQADLGSMWILQHFWKPSEDEA